MGAHPGLALILGTARRLFRARLHAVEAAGPTLLDRPPTPKPTVKWRILAPARARAALLWRLVPCDDPGSIRPPAPPTAVIPSHTRATAASPPPHPSGARPPVIPADRMPRHVAVIMDGNGRWATERGQPCHQGHRAGASAAKDVIHGALEIGLPYLTLYAFSSESWKRDAEEIATLFELLRQEINGKKDPDHDVRVRWAGSAEGLPEDLVEELLSAERNSRHRTALTLTMCVNYGGRAELAHAAQQLLHATRSGDLPPGTVHEQDLAQHLTLAHAPDVDLLWRPGGERRISNFLLCHSAYAELHFTDTLWPDVDRRDLWQAITEYGSRRRRFGAEAAQAHARAGSAPSGMGGRV
ncbi:polyprenyl diphosphate synthase [Streptomyces sp. NBC_01614]|uniref:polyprenyl diphosphate synthase n=1 Tax=Streptomyces sp. NBC_01614 TaxID=2975897 RepID=UPI0038636104